MREILFRGKRVDTGEWVEGYLYRLSEKHNPFIMVKNKCGESHEVLPETVGQFTGLTDKNGNKIFEGDILELIDGQRGVIVFGVHEDAEFSNSSDCLGWFWKSIEEDDEDWAYFAFSDKWETHKVIGNLHDNSELLKGE